VSSSSRCGLAPLACCGPACSLPEPAQNTAPAAAVATHTYLQALCIRQQLYQLTAYWDLIWGCVGQDPYQGTPSVVPTTTAGIPYQGTTSVVLFCQPAGNDGNENKELRPVFSGVPTIAAGIKGFSPWRLLFCEIPGQ
jgi:hypothetical protein